MYKKGHQSVAEYTNGLFCYIITDVAFSFQVKAKMLPTPTKFHYIFNIRDLSRVFQGVLFPENDTISDEGYLIDLWKHECERVFCDKLVSLEDQNWYHESFAELLKKNFGAEVNHLFQLSCFDF